MDRHMQKGVLGTWMDMHNSLVASYLYYSLHSLCFFSLYSLRPCFFSIL
jgi:hypothetical protein